MGQSAKDQVALIAFQLVEGSWYPSHFTGLILVKETKSERCLKLSPHAEVTFALSTQVGVDQTQASSVDHHVLSVCQS